MIGQLIGLLGIVALIWNERRRYERMEAMKYDPARQEAAAQRDLRPASADVTAAPVNAPVYPIEFARARREQDGRGTAA